MRRGVEITGSYQYRYYRDYYPGRHRHPKDVLSTSLERAQDVRAPSGIRDASAVDVK